MPRESTHFIFSRRGSELARKGHYRRPQADGAFRVQPPYGQKEDTVFERGAERQHKCVFWRPMSSEHRVDARRAPGDAAPREASLVVVRQLQSLHELTLVPSVLTFNGVWPYPYPYSASRRRAPLPDEEAMIYL